MRAGADPAVVPHQPAFARSEYAPESFAGRDRYGRGAAAG